MSSEPTISQRAMTAARIVNTTIGGDRVAESPNTISVAVAAERLGVSERSVNVARRVLLNGSDDLIDAVETGEVSLYSANRTLGPKQKPKAVPNVVRCHQCRGNRAEIDRLRERLADMKAERDRYYSELETVRTAMAPSTPIASA